jgi:hypothetical protein
MAMKLTIDGKQFAIEAWTEGIPDWISLRVNGEYLIRCNGTAEIKTLGQWLVNEMERIEREKKP